MKKIILLLPLLFFFLAAVVFAQVEAASFQFSPSSTSVNPGSSFTLDIRVDVGSEQVNSAESFIIFDSSLLEAQAVSAGTFFPSVSNNIEAGRVYIAGMVEDPANSKTGSGTVGTITFKALSEGTATLTFDCSNSKIIKADINATNIITCSDNGTGTVVIGAGGGGSGGDDGGGGSGGDESYVSPSTLPQTGIFENLQKAAIPGLILLIISGIIRLLI